MAWRNTNTSFGLISRLLHWVMAVGILFMLALGTRLAYLQPDLSTLWLYGLHKTIGIIILSLAAVRLIWHRISPAPQPIGPPNAIATQAAKLVHLLFYALFIAIPLTGWFASSATGIDVMLFNRFTLPAIAPVSELWEKRGFVLHGWLTKLLFGLIALHILGALKRHFGGDRTLTRMIKG